MSDPLDLDRTPRITVVIPSLNQGRYLERALCSAIDQGYANLELIVIDGGSDDETVPLLHHYEDDLTYWRSAPDGGPAEAINHALRCATGDIVCVLQADNLLLPGSLHAAAAAFVAPHAPAWAVGHCHRIDESDGHTGRYDAAAAPSLEAFLTQDAGSLPLAGAFFRRDLIARHGGFDVDMRYAYGHEFACRLLGAGVAPGILPHTVAAIREHAASLTARHTLPLGRETIVALERYADAVPLKARIALWKACDERRRIYTLAEAESRQSDARRFLWQQLLRRPGWLASDHYRETLLRRIAQPSADTPHAAAA